MSLCCKPPICRGWGSVLLSSRLPSKPSTGMKNLASDPRSTGHSFLCPLGDQPQPALAQALWGAQPGWPDTIGQGEGES